MQHLPQADSVIQTLQHSECTKFMGLLRRASAEAGLRLQTVQMQVTQYTVLVAEMWKSRGLQRVTFTESKRYKC